MNGRLEALSKSFRPKFGDQQALRIIALGKVRDGLLTTLRKYDKNVSRLEKAVKSKTANERRLELIESSLVHALEEYTKTYL